jgi:hypothetical protein
MFVTCYAPQNKLRPTGNASCGIALLTTMIDGWRKGQREVESSYLDTGTLYVGAYCEPAQGVVSTNL